jgi:hypothetical protein
MWGDRLSPGSKRFFALLGIWTGAITLILAAMCAISADWSNAGWFFYVGVFIGLISIRDLRRASRKAAADL